MISPELARRYYSDDDTSHNYTTIIVVIVVVLIIKICLIVAVCYYRNKKKRERAAKGCTCFNDTDYYCLPWWYWSSDSRCHCGALSGARVNATPYNAPPPPAYTSSPQDASGFQGTPPQQVYQPPYNPYNTSPSAEAGMWNAQQQSMPMKPAEQTYVNGRYY